MPDQKQLRMQRSLSAPLPALPPLPPGFEVITAQTPQGPLAWEQIITDSFGYPSSFDQILNDPTCAPGRVFVLMADGVPAATASVQYPNKQGLGVVHMVGVHSRFLGHGYGRFMVLWALYDMQKSGLTAAALTTDDFRLPAIRTYQKLGFDPVMEDDTMPARWDAVYAKLALHTKQG